MIVLADTGAIYALIDASDAWHARVVAWWQQSRAEVILPASILPEVSYLLQSRIGEQAEQAFVRSIAQGELIVEALEDADYERSADIMQAYRDFPLGFVDASIVAIAERLEVRMILTTDRRHFGVVRPRNVRAFTLVP